MPKNGCYSFPEKFCTTSSSAKMGQNFSGDLSYTGKETNPHLQIRRRYLFGGALGSLGVLPTAVGDGILTTNLDVKATRHGE